MNLKRVRVFCSNCNILSNSKKSYSRFLKKHNEHFVRYITTSEELNCITKHLEIK